MATATVCPVAWIQVGAQADASVRALSIVAGSGVTLTTATAGGVATTTISASGGGGGGTPASTVVSETSYGQSSVVGVGTDYARADHSHGSPSLGSTASTACAGNDGRLSDSRAPSGAAGGDLGGTYPSPTVTRARGLRDSSGTTYAMGAVLEGQYLRVSSGVVVGAFIALALSVSSGVDGIELGGEGDLLTSIESDAGSIV